MKPNYKLAVETNNHKINNKDNKNFYKGRNVNSNYDDKKNIQIKAKSHRKNCSDRSAVVPYTVINNNGNLELFFLFGFYNYTTEYLLKNKVNPDSKDDITDFGGGVKSDENYIVGGLRELHEETKGMFKNIISLKELINCNITCVHHNISGELMHSFFVPLKGEWLDKASSVFEESVNTVKYNEIKSIKWFSEKEFVNLIDGKTINKHKMWAKLRRFYRITYNNDVRNLIYTQYNLVHGVPLKRELVSKDTNITESVPNIVSSCKDGKDCCIESILDKCNIKQLHDHISTHTPYINCVKIPISDAQMVITPKKNINNTIPTHQNSYTLGVGFIPKDMSVNISIKIERIM